MLVDAGYDRMEAYLYCTDRDLLDLVAKKGHRVALLKAVHAVKQEANIEDSETEDVCGVLF